MELDFSGIDSISKKTFENGAVTHVRAEDIVLPSENGKGRTEPAGGCQGHISLQEQQRLLRAAVKVLKDERVDHEAAEGCRQQILLDIGKGRNPYAILLLAAEAIGRLSGCGDSYRSVRV